MTVFQRLAERLRLVPSPFVVVGKDELVDVIVVFKHCRKKIRNEIHSAKAGDLKNQTLNYAGLGSIIEFGQNIDDVTSRLFTVIAVDHDFTPFKQTCCLISRAPRIFFTDTPEQGLRHSQLKTMICVELKNANDRIEPQNHHHKTGTAEWQG